VDNESTRLRAVSAAVGFAPDVFADALVFLPPPRRASLLISILSVDRPRMPLARAAEGMCRPDIMAAGMVVANDLMSRTAPEVRPQAAVADGYRFAKRQGKPALHQFRKPL